MAAKSHPLAELAELDEYLRPAWGEISARIPAWHPRNEGEGEGEGEGAGEGAGNEEGEGSGSGSGEGTGAGSGNEPDWKSESRKHEDRAKKAAKRAEAAEKRLAELEAEGQSEQEQALAKAREEAKAEAKAEAMAERRADRLEVAVTRLAAAGIELKDGDEKIIAKFADPDDALVQVERALAKGELDEEDIFDDEGKVQTDALKSALTDLLDRKPHLRAGEPKQRVRGSADGGKGSGSSSDLDGMTVEDHMRRKGRKTAPKD